MVQQLEPGLYFNLDEEVYHSLPYLSATGIKNILVSDMDFWAGSWMSTSDYSDEEQEDSEAKKIGKAYHKRILEGSDAFYDSYSLPFDDALCIGALDTVDQMQAVLRDKGLRVGGNKPELVARLKEADPTLIFKSDVYNDWFSNELAGRIILPSNVMRRIEIAAAMIERHPHLAKCFTGGYPEVTVIWVNEQGITMKSRIDYLKPKAMIDLKSFFNRMRKNIDRAIYAAMASEKYHIQFSFYMDHAGPAIAKFAREGRVFGYADKRFLAQLGQTKEFDFYAVFQQKGRAPVARGKKFPRRIMHSVGQQAIEDGIRRYVECLRKFGTDPWVDQTPIDEFEDEGFPAYASEL